MIAALPTTGTARDVHAALRATADALTTQASAAELALVTWDHHGDNETGNLLEHLPWAVVEEARRVATKTPLALVDAADVFTVTANRLLGRGPVAVSQLPDTITGYRLLTLQVGEPVKRVLLAEWRARVEEIFTARWRAWAPPVAHRLGASSQPVWLAMVTPRPDLFGKHTAVGCEIVTVPGVPDSACAALVHPAAAELELDDDNGRGRVRLLPGDGVTATQIEVALQLREQARAVDLNAPLTSLAHALAAAGAVLGDRAIPAEPTPDVREALGDLLPKPTPPARPTPATRTVGRPWDDGFAIVA